MEAKQKEEVKVEKTIKELRDPEGRVIYKATYHVPKMHISDTMFFRTRLGAEAFLESFAE